MHVMIVACYHPLPLSACMLHFDLVSILFGTLIPTSFNILVKMFLHFIMYIYVHGSMLALATTCSVVNSSPGSYTSSAFQIQLQHYMHGMVRG